MKRVLAICSMVAVGVTAASISAQDQRQNNQQGLIAVLDVAKVFDNNARFKQRLDQINQEADQFKAHLDAETERLRQDAMALGKQFKPGTQEFKAREVDLETRNAKLRTDARQKQLELMNREARAYYDTYTEMLQTVNQLAHEYSIVLVVNFDSTEIDPENRGEVIAGVNRSVVYHNPTFDLTDQVIRQMSSASASGDNNLRR